MSYMNPGRGNTDEQPPKRSTRDAWLDRPVVWTAVTAAVILALLVALRFFQEGRGTTDKPLHTTLSPVWEIGQLSLYDAITAREYHITPSGHGTFSTPNRMQDLRFTFDTKGFALAPRGTGMEWSMRFEVGRIGRPGHWMEVSPTPRTALEGPELHMVHGPFTIRYANSLEGMRQDFLVYERPGGHGAFQVRMHMSGDLVARSTGADEIIFTTTRNGEERQAFRYNGLLAWDANGDTLQARMSVEGHELVISVDDSLAVYPITIDPLSSTSNTLLEMDQAGAEFGFSTYTAGDVNGDGYSDLGVGAPKFDNGFSDEGAVFVFLGSETGLASTPAWATYGGQAGARHGFAVRTAGDVNGDGYSDLIVGAPRHTGSLFREGSAQVYLGSATGLDMVPAWTTTGGQAEALFGSSVATAGDVNGDGYSDVLVGAPEYDDGQVDEGVVFVYHGSASGPSTSPDQVLQRDQAGAYFGAAISAAGDVNGDGYGDVVIGAPLYTNTLTEEGGIFIYHGSASGLPATPNASRFRGAAVGAGAWMGFSVSFAGDVNGDGYSDVIVGVPNHSLSLSEQGQVLLYRGGVSGILTNPTWTSLGGQAGARFGASVASVGDIDGDGRADVAVGAPFYSNGQTSEGLVRVFKGVSGISIPLSWSNESNQTGAFHGVCVAPAGDVNGDGLADIAIGAHLYSNGQAGEGIVQVFHGRTSAPSTSQTWAAEINQADAKFGQCVSRAGDVNGDGYDDVIVGAPYFSNGQTNEGRAYLYLGASTGVAGSASWTAESDQAGAQFGFSVAAAGDVNGDGYGDVIVGAPLYSNGQTNEGRAYLYLGSASGLSTTPAWTFESDQTNARLGFSVASAGDVNGDGYDDVIVGAYLYTATETSEGRSYVFHGSATGLSATPDWTAESGQANAFFGISVGMAGDVDGDGYDDVIIGASLYDDAFSSEGGAFVYHGSPAGLEATPAWSTFGGPGSPQLGNAVGYAGDVNGDGYSDVFVGVYQGSNGQTGEGLVRIHHGGPGGLSSTPAVVLEADLAGARFGSSVAHAGDLNGDGYGDIIVGAPRFSTMFLQEGRALVYMGGPTGIQSTPAWQVNGGQTGYELGFFVSGAGDVNGDGFGDVIVGIPQYTNGQSQEGRALVFLGNLGAGVPRLTRQYRDDLTTVVQTGNGTFAPGCSWGIGQFARSPLGRSPLKLAWEFQGHGPPFSGTPITNGVQFSGESAGWTNSGLTGTEIKQVLSTTPPNTSHPIWRVRVKQHPATMLNGQVYGRWHYGGIHSGFVPSIKVDLSLCGPLPIELEGFSGTCDGDGVRLGWSTLSETGITRFHIAKSADGTHWERVGTIASSGGAMRTDYHWKAPVDGNVHAGYYRLETEDTHGTVTAEHTLAAPHCPGIRPAGLLVNPNPVAAGRTTVRWQGATDQHYRLAVWSLAGEQLLTRTVTPEGNGDITVLLDTGALSAGTYLVSLLDTNGAVAASARFVVL